MVKKEIRRSSLIEACIRWEEKMDADGSKIGQSELARRWGIPATTLSNWYTLVADPPLARLRYIKERYNKSWSEIGKHIDADSNE